MAVSGIQSVRTTPRNAGSTLAHAAQRAAAERQLGRRSDPRDPDAARLVASQMVSELFFKPLLEEIRASAQGAPFVDGGQTESTFGAQLDQRLADKVAASQTSLIDALASRFDQTSRYSRLQATATEERK